MSSTYDRWIEDRLRANAVYSGTIVGITELMEKGWIDYQTAIERLKEAKVILDKKLSKGLEPEVVN